ncbi:MAG: threonylcarbamoyl-AMP synthase [Candidatus Sericytochromatia bacterium]|nr:threonylcarbamoyl-AMP synthase [Candidatus Sericytochromatia bacterium]
MRTEYLTVSPDSPEPDLIDRAAAVLRAGGLVAFPTETVYGLGAAALDPIAVAGIFRAKGRPSFNPLIVHVLDADMARPLTSAWPETADVLVRTFWPGPLTLVLPKANGVPDAITAGLPSVALRAPSHPVARALIAALGAPIAAPSANRSTAISPTAAAHVAKGLMGRIGMILDGGTTNVGLESTVLSLAEAVPVLLRPGSISREALEAVIGPVRLRTEAPEGETGRPSPGLMTVHYAPRMPTWRFAPGEAPHQPVPAGTAGLITLGMRLPAPEGWRVIRLPETPGGAAAGFYAALHTLEDAGVAAIWVESPPADPAWAGLRDRLDKASRPSPDSDRHGQVV